MMGYHIEAPRFGFDLLPDRILVREDGYLGAYKFYGEPIVDYWYVPEQDAPQATLEKRIDELCQENERLRELACGAMNEADRLTHDAAAFQIENAKLRERAVAMLSELRGVVSEGDYDSPSGRYFLLRRDVAAYEDAMRELGIEVVK